LLAIDIHYANVLEAILAELPRELSRRRLVPIWPNRNETSGYVEGSWFPNLAHTDQTRIFRFVGDALVLDAATAWGQVRIVWEKAPDRSADI
jgi:hypothetical protein